MPDASDVISPLPGGILIPGYGEIELPAGSAGSEVEGLIVFIINHARNLGMLGGVQPEFVQPPIFRSEGGMMDIAEVVGGHEQLAIATLYEVRMRVASILISYASLAVTQWHIDTAAIIQICKNQRVPDDQLDRIKNALGVRGIQTGGRD